MLPQVTRLYKGDWRRKPSLRELVGTVQAVLEAQLQDHTSDGESAELASLTFKTRKIPKRQKYANGDVLKATAALTERNLMLRVGKMRGPTSTRVWQRRLRFRVRGLIVVILLISGCLGWAVRCASSTMRWRRSNGLAVSCGTIGSLKTANSTLTEDPLSRDG